MWLPIQLGCGCAICPHSWLWLHGSESAHELIRNEGFVLERGLGTLNCPQCLDRVTQGLCRCTFKQV